MPNVRSLRCGVVLGTSALPFRAVFTTTFGGATMRLDVSEEDFHIEAELECDERALAALISVAARHGFVPMDERETPPVYCPETDRLRIYLACEIPNLLAERPEAPTFERVIL